MQQKIYFFMLFLFVAIQTNAQRLHHDYVEYKIGDRYYVRYGNEWRMYAPDTAMAHKNIRMQKSVRYDIHKKTEKKRLKLTTEKYFDTAGLLVCEMLKDKKSKAFIKDSFVYTASNLLTSEIIFKNDKLLYRINYMFDSAKRLVRYEFHSGEKNKLRTLKKYIYKDKKLAFKYYYEKDTNNYKYIYTNNYVNDTGDLLSTVLQDAKGNTKFTTDYDCNHLGILNKKENKNQAHYCKNKQVLENGHYQEIWNEERGKEHYRFIYEFDTNNICVESWFYMGKFADKLYHHYIYHAYADSITEEQLAFDVKGNLTQKRYSIKNRLGLIIQNANYFYRKNGKLANAWTTAYEYKNGLLVGQQSFSSRNIFNWGEFISTEYSGTE
jgi:hypothetical protein